MTAIRHPRAVGFVCAVCACLSGPVRADDDAKRLCASAFTSAQRLMRSGDLIEARKKLVFCGGPECPAIMHADCQQWLSSVEASMPTVVFQVSSTTGAPPEAVRMSLDGGDAIALDGRALPVNPGEHTLVFEASGFRASSRHLVVSEGEKLRREVVVLEPAPVPKVMGELPAKSRWRSGVNPHRSEPREGTAPLPYQRLAVAGPPPSAPASRRLTFPAIVAASGAALAGAGALYFGLAARSDERDLDHCRPNCSRDDVDHVKREYVFANLSIGLAVAGITTAALLYLYSGKDSSSATRVGLNAGSGLLGLNATGSF